MKIIDIALITSQSILSTVGMVIIKSSIKSFPSLNDAMLATILSPLFWIGFSVQLSAFGLWVVVLRRNEISIALPIAVGVYAIASLVAGSILKEPITLSKVIGATLIVCGIFVMYNFSPST